MNKKLLFISLSVLSIFIAIFAVIVISADKKTNNKTDFVPIETYVKNEYKLEEDSLKESSDYEEDDSNSFCFNFDEVPLYSGEPYVEINNNKPLFLEKEINTNVFENYSDLDNLGRCGEAFANLCIELMPVEERGEIGYIKPSGWQTVKYNDLIEGNYLYNRCHLIGYQLAGENDNELNLITGTRYLNTMGMLPFENEVTSYILQTGNHVLYRVKPIFCDDNLVASGITMEAYSVEDDGAGICFYVYVYNVQPGIIIDYASGESELDSDYINSEEFILEQEISVDIEDEINEAVIDYRYVINTNSSKFHLPACDSVNEMKEKNKKYTNESREELIEQGYLPCKACNP